MEVTLAMTHYTGDVKPEDATSYRQTETQWGDRDTNPPNKLLNQNLSCYKK